MECLDENTLLGACKGPIEYRESLSGTGISYPRCDFHWDMRLDLQDQINDRYPYHQPADFDPTYAGERWDDDY
jgi:hypothetical protein